MNNIRFHILTIFPELFPGPLDSGVVGRAVRNGTVSLETHNPRDFTRDIHRTVDDSPYGGGAGMIMKPDPIFECLDSLGTPAPFRILVSPQGIPWNQRLAREIATRNNRIAIVCGRYEGVDERIREHAVDLDVSIGDYVISGGEIAAYILVETMARLIPGVVGSQESVETDSFSPDTGGLLKYPQYTRPSDFRGWKVPDILLSGNHAEIRKWRVKMAELRTQARRPDLLTCKTTHNDDMNATLLSKRRRIKEKARGCNESTS